MGRLCIKKGEVSSYCPLSYLNPKHQNIGIKRKGRKKKKISNMPKIKTTPRSQLQKCPWCPYKTLDMDDLKEHLVECGMSAMNKRYTCTVVGCSYMSNKVSNVKRHKKVHVKDEPKGADIVPDIELSSDTDECLRKDPGQIIGPISTGEETNSDENNNEDQTNKIDPITEATKKVKEDNVGQLIEGMKQADNAAVQENNKEVKSSLIVRKDVEVGRIIRKPTKPIIMATKKRPFHGLSSTEANKLSPKDLRHVIPRAPTKVVNSGKGVEIGTQASALTTVRRTVTTKTTYEENGRNVEIIEVVEQVL